MSETAVVHSTFVIERNFPVPPERVFAALSDPAKKRRWFAEGEGSTTESFEMDFRVGGTERTVRRAKNGLAFTNDTVFRDIVSGTRVVIAYNMSVNDRRISSSLITYELFANGKGTDLIFTEQAAFFEGADGPKIREEGWSKLLDWLGNYLAN
jgi:uncharacterized protein YndB with AHSA1/START domain